MFPRSLPPRAARPAAAAALLLLLAAAAPPGPLANPQAGAAEGAAPAAFAAADWSLRTTEGADVSLHGALARGPVLVTFWALWCNPCLKELPHLDALARDTAGRLTVLAVNQDTPRSVARVRPYLQSKQIGLTVLLDTSGDVARRMQVGGTLPFLVLLDAGGREVYRHVGYREGDEAALRAQVLALLGTAPADGDSAR